jgi:3-oxoacyl-(acyl-carrier-protein) synthase
MSLAIAGMGWVTPLGGDVAGVWQRLHDGKTATAESISSPLGPSYSAFKVPPDAVTPVAHPRLRRSSAISRFAAAASMAALENAGLKPDPETMARFALVFAVSNGGVIYTKRFFDEIVNSGARAASPLLFPETVFNAPASHLAAILSITGATYTLVGDGAVGILAVKMAEDLMRNRNLDHCLVVGAEETDWLLCDAYRKWRLLRSAPPIEPFRKPSKGLILSEGAGAIVISRSGPVQIEAIAAGTNFRRQSEAAGAVEKVFATIASRDTDVVVASANGTFVDEAERAAILRHCPESSVLAMKGAVGESVGASSLWQMICGAQLLMTQSTPANLIHSVAEKSRDTARRNEAPFRRALISVCGLNQQVGGVTLLKT